MPTTTARIYNFSAGPAVMPRPVLEQAQRDLVALPGVGMSVMEISHRSKAFEDLLAGAIADMRSLANISDDYAILMLQGGASLQFSMVPANLLPPGGTADYIDTGTWADKAVKEAARVGTVHVTGSTKADGYNRIPEAHEVTLTPGAAYVHLTSNNTIEGTEWKAWPETGGVPLISDASSDIFSGPIDVSRFGLIYAGAQKNLGPSGVTVVIIRKDLLARAADGLPSMMSYKVHAENNSLYNTPPTFSVYLLRNVLDVVKSGGGLAAMEKHNRKKGELVYAAIDARPDLYRCPVERESRSLMNIVFTLPTPELEAEFLAGAKKLKMEGLKGHRSVGGIRVSTYNAAELAWSETLAGFMNDFHKGS
jgi:phosphoserine aminotransferase